ncbi:MAG: hypothetical protein J6Y03_00345 [Alphaproteobacteria bacterium]|nr:hypothetical protein [Alphaproteobacteria bacterium]
MKKILSVFILTFIIALSVNAKEQKIYYRDKVKCNDERTFCKDEKGNPITGIVESIKNGKRIIAIEYRNGFKEGKRIVYSSDGIHPVLEFSTNRNGDLDGKSKSYWGDTHTIRSKATWKKGEQKGKSIMYYKSGKKQWTSQIIEPIESVDVTPMKFEFFDRNEQLFATFDINGITCYDKDKKARNATTAEKILKINAIWEEMENALTNPELNPNKEPDFTFLCE